MNGEDALTVPTIPDWTKWTCRPAHLTRVIIETYECHGSDKKELSHVLLKVKGQGTPFLIGWDHNDRAANPRENAYAAIYKGDKWIVGARGTGFTTQ